MPEISASSNSTGAHTHSRGTMEISGNTAINFGSNINYMAPSGAFYRTSSKIQSLSGGGYNNSIVTLGFMASKNWTGATSSNGDHSHTITLHSDFLNKSDTVQPPSVRVRTKTRYY